MNKLVIDLNNKKFKSLSNSDNGEVSDATIFHYYQQEQCIWAEYHGGEIIRGFIVGKIVNDQLEFTYQHLNTAFELMTGKCISSPAINESGKITLHERWQWTCRDFSIGESILVEI